MPRGAYSRTPKAAPKAASPRAARPAPVVSETDVRAVNTVQAGEEAKAVAALASHPAARQDRQSAVRTERRTRRGTTLDGMQNRALDLPPSLADDPNHVYRWANDEGARIYNLTVNGEWDAVPDQGGEIAQNQSTRRPVGTTKQGAPLYAQLLRKPRVIHEEDEADKMAAIDEREKGILRSAKSSPDDNRPEAVSYATPGNKITSNRRGPYVP